MTSTVTASASRPAGMRRLRIAAYVMIAAGASMAAMPFVGPLVGVPFDGGEAWMLDRNRAVLHLVPGVLGALLGVALLLAASPRRGSAAHDAPLAGVRVLARVGMAVALWNALGPWLLTPLLGQGDSALMFQTIAGFHDFSTLKQILLELGCHWFPGTVSLLAAWTAYRVGAPVLSGGTDGGRLASYPSPATIGRGR